MILSKTKGCKEPETHRSGSQGGAQAHGERGKTSFARLRCPQTQQGRESQKKLQDPARVRGTPALGLPGAASAPHPPPLAGRGGARAQKTPTSERARAHPANSWPRPGPREESGQETPGRPGAGADGPGRRPSAAGGMRFGGRGRGEGAGTYSGSRDSPNGRQKELLKIGSGPREEVGDQKGTRNTLHIHL